jgi:undecaprenyl-diphosphatase
MNTIWRWDEDTFRSINLGWHSTWLDPIFFVVSSTGLGWVQALIILGFFPWKALRTKTKRRKALASTAPLLLCAWAFTGIVDTAIKHAVPRDRPSNEPWALPQENVHAWSFASGHTASSFGIAFAFFFLTRGTKLSNWGWAGLVWAGLVGFSRIYRGVHWPSDVLSGFFVGLGCACVFMAVVNRLRSNARQG